MIDNPVFEELEEDITETTTEENKERVRPVQEITRDEFMELIPIPALNLPNIRETACFVPKDGRPFMVFLCETIDEYRGPCPVCKSHSHEGHGSLPQLRTVHDVNVGNIQVDIYLKARRRECQNCHATFVEPIDAVVESRQMTRRLYEQIRSNAFRYKFTDVAYDSGYSLTTIGAIFDEYAEELEAKRGPIVAPTVLGIDEKHIVNTKRGMFVDIETGRILEMTPTNDEDTVISTIKRMVGYKENIRLVTMDMSSGYKKYVEDTIPHAKIIVDKYHVMQDLGLKVRKTRTKLIDYLQEEIADISDESERREKRLVYNLFATDGYLFKYNHNNLSNRNKIIMADVCGTFPEINHLRLLKEGFERIYEAESREEAEARYAEWTKLLPGTLISEIRSWEKAYQLDHKLFSEFQSLQSTMKKWNKYIFNYFDEGCQFTNAATEGLNQLVDRLNKLGNGYSFKRLRARALFAHEAAPSVRYSAKEYKKKLPKGKKGVSTTNPRMDMVWPIFPPPPEEFAYYHSIEPDETIPALHELTIYNYSNHPICTGL